MVRDLCKVNYQTLLIAYLKLTKKNARNAWEKTKLNRNVILLGQKIIDYVTDVRNTKTNAISQ